MNEILGIVIEIVIELVLGVFSLFIAWKIMGLIHRLDKLSVGMPLAILATILVMFGLGLLVMPFFQSVQIMVVLENKKRYDTAVEEGYVFYLDEEVIDVDEVNPDEYHIILYKDSGKARISPKNA